MPIVTPKQESIQYDGANGAHITGEWLAAITPVSDDGQTLVFRNMEGSEYTVEAGGWVICAPGNRMFPQVVTAADYTTYWVELG